MEIQRALQIAQREWENIRVSLENCGDTGEFGENSVCLLQIEGLHLIRNLIEMENKLPKSGYFTGEAASIFTNLASIAAERVGLKGNLAQVFGTGYSWVRTGCFNLNSIYVEEPKHIIKQLFFFKLFFPIGGGFNWDFNSPVIKTKLHLVFHKFIAWQCAPGSYVQDVKDYKSQIEPLLRGLSLALDTSIGYNSPKTREWADLGFKRVSMHLEETSNHFR
jgi:hypothetical protein